MALRGPRTYGESKITQRDPRKRRKRRRLSEPTPVTPSERQAASESSCRPSATDLACVVRQSCRRRMRAPCRVRRRVSSDITAPPAICVASPVRLCQSRRRRREASAETRASRRADRAPSASSCVRRSCRRHTRAPCRVRRVSSDITTNFCSLRRSAPLRSAQLGRGRAPVGRSVRGRFGNCPQHAAAGNTPHSTSQNHPGYRAPLRRRRTAALWCPRGVRFMVRFCVIKADTTAWSLNGAFPPCVYVHVYVLCWQAPGRTIQAADSGARVAYFCCVFTGSPTGLVLYGHGSLARRRPRPVTHHHLLMYFCCIKKRPWGMGICYW